MASDVQLGTEAQGIEKESGQLAVVVNTSGQKRKFLTDLVVHVAGRIPEIDDLDLGAAGVESDELGVAVNEFLQSMSSTAVTLRATGRERGPPSDARGKSRWNGRCFESAQRKSSKAELPSNSNSGLYHSATGLRGP